MDSDLLLISSPEQLVLLLNSLSGLPTHPPSLYFDLEGVCLGRLGSISLILSNVAPHSTTYILDVHVLGAKIFSTRNKLGNSFQRILECARTPKVFFDIRNDSDALYSHYGVRMNGVIDLQLLELATRTGPVEYVAGLARCIMNDVSLPRNIIDVWQRTKTHGQSLYDPQKGGSYSVFNARPIDPQILLYCKQDVEILPLLWDVYSSKILVPANGFWRSMVKEATQDRIRMSQHQGYDGQSESKKLGPWDL